MLQLFGRIFCQILTIKGKRNTNEVSNYYRVPLCRHPRNIKFWTVARKTCRLCAIKEPEVVTQSIFFNLFREILKLKDGGEVALDWLDEGCSEDSPIIIILPGLTGESQAEYVKFLVMAANQTGMRTVVFNNRGLGGLPLRTPRLYCAANTEDLAEVVNHVHNKFPNVKKAAAGVSMGGLILGMQTLSKNNL